MKEKKGRSPGRPIRIFRTPGIRLRDLLWILPGLALPLAALLYGASLIYYGYAQGSEQVFWAAAAGLLLIPFGILSLRSFQRARRAVVVHANGLRLVRFRGRTRFVFWDQVDSVRITGSRYLLFGSALSDRQAIHLHTTGGQEVRIDPDIEGIAELAEIIREQTGPHIARRLMFSGQNAETLDFGPVSVDAGGLQVRGRSLPWQNLAAMHVDAGMLVIKSIDQNLKLPAADIPNLDQLLEIATQRTMTD